MTKVTKNEKLLRKATGKWEKFLAEGAFKKTLKEFDEDDAYHFDQDKHSEPDRTAAGNFDMGDKVKVMNRGNEYDEPEELRCRVGTVTGMDGKDLTIKFDDNGEVATITYFNAARDEYDLWNTSSLYKCPEEQVNEAKMGEYGKIDAEDGNPPSKIGRGNEEYMAAYNAVLQARGEEPLDIQQPDQAYLDALRSGQLEENEMSEGDDWYSDEHETLADKMFADSQAAAQEEQGFQVGEFVYIVNGSLKGASGKILEPVTTSTGEEGFAIELYSDAKMKVFGKRGDEVIALPQDLESGGTTDDMELYDIDEAVSGKEQYYLKQQNRAKGAAMALYHEAGGEGTTIPGPFVKKQARIIVDAMVALEGMVTSDSIDERSEDDERDLEPPVKYGSGAELEFDKKAQKFYDRKRDMYMDDPEEEDNLTRENNPSSFASRVTHSSDPEMDQVMDIAADMLELGARSRIPVSLVGVESALQKQGFDTNMEKGMLIVDDKYVIADKKSLPASAQKISFTSYAADYLSNLQGEQQDLPLS